MMRALAVVLLLLGCGAKPGGKLVKRGGIITVEWVR